MKKVLITGIGGFVGSHVAEHFLKTMDYLVVGIDSWRHKGDSLRLRHLMHDPRLSIYTHDLTTPISYRLEERIGSIDYILAIASESHVDRSITDPVPFVQNNVSLALQIAEYARRVKPRALIHCSTDEVFGPAIGSDAHTEWLPSLPSNPYAASKSAQDAIYYSYWRTYGLPLIVTHTMNMIGERQDPEKFIPMCISRIDRGETVTIHGKDGDIGSRMYLHARNLADAWRHLIEKTEPYLYQDDHSRYQYPNSYNIAGEVEIDNLTLAKMIASIMGKELKYELVDFHAARPGHDRRYALDSRKITESGWKPPVPFDQSLAKLVRWTLDHREWLR